MLATLNPKELPKREFPDKIIIYYYENIVFRRLVLIHGNMHFKRFVQLYIHRVSFYQ